MKQKMMTIREFIETNEHILNKDKPLITLQNYDGNIWYENYPYVDFVNWLPESMFDRKLKCIYYPDYHHLTLSAYISVEDTKLLASLNY